MECVSGTRLASALAMRRRELWDSNPRLAERIEMRIKDAQPEDGVSTAAAKTVDVFGGGNLVAASATARGAAQAAIGPGAQPPPAPAPVTVASPAWPPPGALGNGCAQDVAS